MIFWGGFSLGIRGNNLRRAGVREWAGEEASTGLSRALLSLGKHCNLVWTCFPSLATSRHITHLMTSRGGKHGILLLESDRKREKRFRSLGMRGRGRPQRGHSGCIGNTTNTTRGVESARHLLPPLLSPPSRLLRSITHLPTYLNIWYCNDEKEEPSSKAALTPHHSHSYLQLGFVLFCFLPLSAALAGPKSAHIWASPYMETCNPNWAGVT